MTEKELLYEIHVRRIRAHWGKKYDVTRQPWPKTDAEWRQTPHGAPWDTNVDMAKWHLNFANELFKAGLLKGE